MSNRVSVSAKITITVSVPVGVFHSTETVDQLHSIAKREGVAAIKNRMKDVSFDVEGEPNVILTTVETEK